MLRVPTWRLGLSSMFALLLGITPALAPRMGHAQAGPFGYSVRSDVDDILYRINLSTGATTAIGPVGFGDVEALAFDCDGTLFGIDDVTNQLIRIDLATGAGTAIGPLGVNITDMGLTFDAAGDLFMSVDAPAPLNFFRINKATGAATAIGPQGQAVTGLTARGTPNEVLGLGGDNTNNLVRMNTATGAAVPIGPLGAGLNVSDGGLDFDANGILWGINDTSQIFTINPLTGAATLGATTLSGFESLAIQGCRSAGGTPGAPVDGPKSDDAVNGQNSDDDNERRQKETEAQRHQRERTNRGSEADVRTEGNVLAVVAAPELRSLLVTIGVTRDEKLVVQVPCGDKVGKLDCPDIRVGDYLEADGYQNGVGDPNDYFVAVDGIEVWRNGKKVK